MKILLRILLISVIALLASCKKCSDFRALNFSDADWESVDPFEANKMLMEDLKLLLKKHQENPNASFPEDEMQTFYGRLLENFQFFMPGKDSKPSFPLTCKGRPENLTEEESREKERLLQSWSEGELLQLRPEPLGKQTEAGFNTIGLKADLDGVASVLQADAKTETAMQAVMLLAIRRMLTDWECKGEAKLYWWTFKGKRSLLYITHRIAIVFYENALGKLEIVFCLNREYFRNIYKDAEYGNSEA